MNEAKLPVRLPPPADPPNPSVFWSKLLANLTRIPFARDLLAAYFCALDAQTPTRVKGVLFGAIAYFILPADAIPDVMFGLGFSDDAAVIATVIGLLGRHIRPRHYERADEKIASLN